MDIDIVDIETVNILIEIGTLTYEDE